MGMGVIEMKRINSIRQVKKHLRSPFDRILPMSVTTYTDTFYDVRKGMFIDHAEVYYLYGDFKSRTVNMTFKRRKTVASEFLDETYMLFSLPDREIVKHG